MNDESDSKQAPQRSWLERLSQALLREPQDREQLVTLLRDAETRELLDADALAMIEGVLDVSEMQVRDIMIPRSQMISINEEQNLNEFLPHIIESAHSRFPVMAENHDEVMGIIHAKDLLKYVTGKHHKFDLQSILRPAEFVPESKHLDILLKEFRIKHNHMVIVIDEYGGIAGLVTIEDVLEQIVGEIEDEFDIEEDAPIKKHRDNEHTVKALTTIEEFNDYFETDLSDEEFDTIGGLVTHTFGHLPKRGESVRIDKFQFKVLHADNRRIHLLQVLSD